MNVLEMSQGGEEEEPKRVNFDANNLSGRPQGDGSGMMFHSGDEEDVANQAGAPGALMDGEEDPQAEPKRQKLNLQFGNITGIPSALGMTGGGHEDIENGTNYTKQQSDSRPA